MRGRGRAPKVYVTYLGVKFTVTSSWCLNCLFMISSVSQSVMQLIKQWVSVCHWYNSPSVTQRSSLSVRRSIYICLLSVSWSVYLSGSHTKLKTKLLPVWWKFIRRNLHDSYYISMFIIQHILDAWRMAILGLLANKLTSHIGLTKFCTTIVK